jgi:DNA-directed RNA polymerase specialized sigma subunit
VEKSEISLEMLVALGALDGRDREIVVDRVVLGQTLQRVADRHGGISRGRVQQLERRGLAVLAVELKRLAFER